MSLCRASIFSTILCLSIVVSGFCTSAYAWTGDRTIMFLASENPDTLVVKVTPALPSSGCTYTDSAYLIPSNGSNVNYATGAPLAMAAYLYGRTVDLNLSGCTANGRAIII